MQAFNSVCRSQKLGHRGGFLAHHRALLRSTKLANGLATMDVRMHIAELSVPVVAPTTEETYKVSEVAYEQDAKGLKRLKYQSAGWQYWNWEGKTIHYVQAGMKGDPVVVLVHGYGASTYHWRYNIPALADAGYNVYALDLLGFGMSEKALVDYSNGKVWVREISSFLREVVGCGADDCQRAVLVGNSLGGYVSLSTAAEHPDLVRAVALLNGAGPFEDAATQQQAARPEQPSWWDNLVKTVQRAVKRGVMQFAFLRAKQPQRIDEVLRMVYAQYDNVDADLVTSIVNPALDPKASEVFFLVSENNEPPVTVNSLLARLKVPLLLLWGDLDPWITPSRADKMEALYPSATRVRLQAGHCPHDDMPEEANAALVDWLRGLAK